MAKIKIRTNPDGTVMAQVTVNVRGTERKVTGKARPESNPMGSNPERFRAAVMALQDETSKIWATAGKEEMV